MGIWNLIWIGTDKVSEALGPGTAWVATKGFRVVTSRKERTQTKCNEKRGDSMRHEIRNAQGSLLGMCPSAEFCMISFDLQPQPLADGIRYINEWLITSKIRNLHDWRVILLSYDRDLIWIRDGW